MPDGIRSLLRKIGMKKKIEDLIIFLISAACLWLAGYSLLFGGLEGSLF